MRIETLYDRRRGLDLHGCVVLQGWRQVDGGEEAKDLYATNSNGVQLRTLMLKRSATTDIDAFIFIYEIRLLLLRHVVLLDVLIMFLFLSCKHINMYLREHKLLEIGMDGSIVVQPHHVLCLEPLNFSAQPTSPYHK